MQGSRRPRIIARIATGGGSRESEEHSYQNAMIKVECQEEMHFKTNGLPSTTFGFPSTFTIIPTLAY